MKKLAAFAAILIFVYVAQGFVTASARKKLSRIGEQKVAAQARIDNIQSKMQELGGGLARVVPPGADSTGKAIPAKDEILPFLLDRLASLGRTNEIQVFSLTPEPFKAVTFPVAEGAAPGAYEKIDVTMRMKCRYRNLGEYLKGIENLNIPVSVTGFSMSSVAGQPVLDTSLQLVTYAHD